MIDLANEYLACRRKLGYALASQGRHILAFARFAERAAPGQPFRTALALQWATLPGSRSRSYLAARLGALRNFARYCATIDARSEVPDARLLGPVYQRRIPHIYSPEQIALVMQRARALPADRSPLHARTYETIIGLIAATGLRPGEALRLRLDDFDAPGALLRVLPNKTSALRHLPLHPSTVRALQAYRRSRQRAFPSGESFFVGQYGRPVQLHQLEFVFRQLTRSLPASGSRPAPRLMDLRHTFATRLIARWTRQKAPVAHRLLLLSRYLGHRHFISTWWYVSGDPAALRHAAEQFRRFHGQSHASHE